MQPVKYYNYNGCKLFYIWGHSWEFDYNNGWEHMEKVCEKLSGHDDIWYATNIEIYDYVQGYNALRFSADSSIVYNPNLFTVYFEVDEVPYSVEPGETIHIKQ